MSCYTLNILNIKKKINLLIPILPNQTILEAAKKYKLYLPYSCCVGSCSTCLGKLVSGSINQDKQSFLDKELLKQNYILTCVSYLTSNSIILTHEEENLYTG
jgi:ferredoxin